MIKNLLNAHPLSQACISMCGDLQVPVAYFQLPTYKLPCYWAAVAPQHGGSVEVTPRTLCRYKVLMLRLQKHIDLKI